MTTSTIAELQAKYEQLEKDYKSQRIGLEKQIAEAKKVYQADAVSKIRALMAEHGLNAEDIGLSKKPRKVNRPGSVAAKYRGPDGQTWTGRGRPPTWVGESREQYRIKD